MFNEVSGVSVMVTRSFEAGPVSPAVFDEPEMGRCTLADGSRLLLASDGLWDVISADEAAKLVVKIRDPRKAAKVLSDAAKALRAERGLPVDDISALVVDLDARAAAVTSNSSVMAHTLPKTHPDLAECDGITIYSQSLNQGRPNSPTLAAQ